MNEPSTLDSALLHILQHSLGVDEFSRGHQYRNYFVTGPNSKDWDFCQTLVERGLMTDHGPQSIAGGMHCFTVTDEGKRSVTRFSPKPPKVSRGRQRYLDYLRSDSGMKFIEWLRWSAHIRKEGFA